MSELLHLVCPHCDAVNRLPASRVTEAPTCGKCKQALFSAQVLELTTANFDIIPLGDYRSDVGQDHFHYYYRPRKNVVNRPTSLGGRGYYIMGNHLDTIPKLYSLLTGGPQGKREGE